eukprot:TRINITY_DN1950_c0_g1_i8.p2 TRINITY_DN1950_c0_g1~~TRINITY_DN1950_c0_g1_i8.p2  ORF type:complete len:197 (+),score=-0.44 TRINITY_DN1950_c0_g1_i8:284-874(+)
MSNIYQTSISKLKFYPIFSKIQIQQRQQQTYCGINFFDTNIQISSNSFFVFFPSYKLNGYNIESCEIISIELVIRICTNRNRFQMWSCNWQVNMCHIYQSFCLYWRQQLERKNDIDFKYDNVIGGNNQKERLTSILNDNVKIDIDFKYDNVIGGNNQKERLTSILNDNVIDKVTCAHLSIILFGLEVITSVKKKNQ